MNIFVWKLSKIAAPKKKKILHFFHFFSIFFGFRSFLTVFLPPLPKVGCPIFLEFRNPWGKVMERSGLRYEHFCLKIFLNHRAKKVFFFTFFGLLRFSVFFNGLFAPTSRSRMSNIFRDSESLGKSNDKKWSQIWTFSFENCLKSPRKKKFFLLLFSLLRYRFTVFLPPLPEVGCPIFLEIPNPWEKVMERSGLTFEYFCLEVV